LQITLLKQNIGSIFCPPGSSSLDSKPSSMRAGTSKKLSEEIKNGDEMLNSVLNPKFLEMHNAQVLCGPIKLA
ncbi:unnamed protein product, partial [Lymnaea stagnalis]